jgi:pirin-like protein
MFTTEAKMSWQPCDDPAPGDKPCDAIETVIVPRARDLGSRITIRARSDARFMTLGGEPMDGPRLIWWNFVSSRMDRIEQAKADWKAARFDSVPGDSEFIPLPEPEPRSVRYP